MKLFEFSGKTGKIQQPQQNVNSMITLQAAQHIQLDAVMMSEMKNVATHGCSAIRRVSGGLLVGGKVTLSDWSQGALSEEVVTKVFQQLHI